MMTVQAVAVLCAWLLVAGCGTSHDHEVKAPPSMQVGQRASVSVTGLFNAEDRILWTATGGRFEGPVDQPTATFVATEPGEVTVLCTTSSGGRTAVKEAKIKIAPQVTQGPAAAAAGPAAPPMGSMGQPLKIEDAGFAPVGWMGDAAQVGKDGKPLFMLLADRNTERPHSPPYCYKLGYKPGPAGWAAIAWQYSTTGRHNFGTEPGRNLRAGGYSQVSVWARALRDKDGRLPKVQFKVGGHTDPTARYQASFEVVGDFVTLTEEWKEYTLDIRGRDLSQVISAFVVVIRAVDIGPGGATFYLDDIEYQ